MTARAPNSRTKGSSLLNGSGFVSDYVMAANRIRQLPEVAFRLTRILGIDRCAAAPLRDDLQYMIGVGWQVENSSPN